MSEHTYVEHHASYTASLSTQRALTHKGCRKYAGVAEFHEAALR
jgi:hypothetical protein